MSTKKMIIFQKSSPICVLALENAEEPAKFLMLFPALAAKNLQKGWAKTGRLNLFFVDRVAAIRADYDSPQDTQTMELLK